MPLNLNAHWKQSSASRRDDQLRDLLKEGQRAPGAFRRKAEQAEPITKEGCGSLTLDRVNYSKCLPPHAIHIYIYLDIYIYILRYK